MLRKVKTDVPRERALENLRIEHQHKRGTNRAWDAIASLEEELKCQDAQIMALALQLKAEETECGHLHQNCPCYWSNTD